MKLPTVAFVLAPALTPLLAGCGSDAGAEKTSSPDSPTSAASAGTDAYTGSFTVNGRSLHLECTGDGPLTLVLEPGEGGTAATLDPIRDAYDDRYRVCGYDRANTGQSDPAPTPRDAVDVLDDLHGLLETARVPGPYLLVGTSAGGSIVLGYAISYPQDVAGVVSMNLVPPWREWKAQGLPEMTPRERADETAYYRGENGEAFDYRTMGDVIDSGTPPDVPLHLLISTIAQCDSPTDICGRTYPAYTAIARSISEHWPGGVFSQTEASHDIYVDAPEAVDAAIDDVLARTE